MFGEKVPERGGRNGKIERVTLSTVRETVVLDGFGIDVDLVIINMTARMIKPTFWYNITEGKKEVTEKERTKHQHLTHSTHN